MSSKLNWERATVTQRLRTATHDDAVDRRYRLALHAWESLAARRARGHRTACLCPDRRRPHEATAPCPHLLPRRPPPRHP